MSFLITAACIKYTSCYVMLCCIFSVRLRILLMLKLLGHCIRTLSTHSVCMTLNGPVSDLLTSDWSGRLLSSLSDLK